MNAEQRLAVYAIVFALLAIALRDTLVGALAIVGSGMSLLWLILLDLFRADEDPGADPDWIDPRNLKREAAEFKVGGRPTIRQAGSGLSTPPGSNDSAQQSARPTQGGPR